MWMVYGFFFHDFASFDGTLLRWAQKSQNAILRIVKRVLGALWVYSAGVTFIAVARVAC